MKKGIAHILRISLLLGAVQFTLACGGDSGGDGIDYVAIGASDATGIGASSPTKGYVFEIQDGIEAQTNHKVVLFNLGIPGAEVQQMKDIEGPAAELLEPDLISIWAGGNDLVSGVSEQSFSDDLDAMLRSLTSNTSGFIVIANLPDLTLLPKFQQDPDADVTVARIAAYNAIISTLANRYGVALVDLASTPFENVLVSSDGFHPSNQGHQEIANKFLEVILPHFSQVSG